MPSILTCGLIASDVYSDMPRGTSEFHSVPISGGSIFERGNHFAAAAYCGSGGVGVIAYRGSQELEDWVYDDVDIAIGNLPTNQIGDAFSFFSLAKARLSEKGCRRFIIVGHSLGGGLAAVVASRVTTVAVRGVTFNAPGLASFNALSVPADADEDAEFLTAGRAIFGVDTPHIVRPGAAMVFAMEAVKKLGAKTAEALLVQSKAKINIPSANRHNVWNVRSTTDPVSLRGQHIGNAPYSISGGGYHPMGALLEKLRTNTVGGYII